MTLILFALFNKQKNENVKEDFQIRLKYVKNAFKKIIKQQKIIKMRKTLILMILILFIDNYISTANLHENVMNKSLGLKI